MSVLRTIVGSNTDFYYIGKRCLHSVVEKECGHIHDVNFKVTIYQLKIPQ